MFTHLYVSEADAKRLFEAFAPKPLAPGQFGAMTEATFERHFELYSSTHLGKLGASLDSEEPEGCYALKFREYVAHMPRELVDMGIELLRAEILRYHSAPTKARAGYYEDPASGFTATVERFFPTQAVSNNPVPLYAQNIRVSGPSLKAAQEFNSKLSSGSFNRFLVNAFE